MISACRQATESPRGFHGGLFLAASRDETTHRRVCTLKQDVTASARGTGSTPAIVRDTLGIHVLNDGVCSGQPIFRDSFHYQRQSLPRTA